MVVDAGQMNRDETSMDERFGVSGWEYLSCTPLYLRMYPWSHLLSTALDHSFCTTITCNT